jgi:hypothetical protein
MQAWEAEMEFTKLITIILRSFLMGVSASKSQLTQPCCLYYKSFRIVIYDRNDSTIVIYDCNDIGHYYKIINYIAYDRKLQL